MLSRRGARHGLTCPPSTMSARHSWAGLDARSRELHRETAEALGVLVLAVHRQRDGVRGEREGRLLRDPSPCSQSNGAGSDDLEELRAGEPRRRGELDEERSRARSSASSIAAALEELPVRSAAQGLSRALALRRAAPAETSRGRQVDAEDAEPLPAAPDRVSDGPPGARWTARARRRAPPSRAATSVRARAPLDQPLARGVIAGQRGALGCIPHQRKPEVVQVGAPGLGGEKLEPGGEVAQRRRIRRRGARDAARAVFEVREPACARPARGGPPRGGGDPRSSRWRRRERPPGRARAATAQSLRCSSSCAASPAIAGWPPGCGRGRSGTRARSRRRARPAVPPAHGNRGRDGAGTMSPSCTGLHSALATSSSVSPRTPASWPRPNTVPTHAAVRRTPARARAASRGSSRADRRRSP